MIITWISTYTGMTEYELENLVIQLIASLAFAMTEDGNKHQDTINTPKLFF